MFNVFSAASVSLVLSLTSAHATAHRMGGRAEFTHGGRPYAYGIGAAQAVAGGQGVVQITWSNSRQVPYMDVKASDLLISYEYDKNGRLVDRKVWPDRDPQIVVGSRS